MRTLFISAFVLLSLVAGAQAAPRGGDEFNLDLIKQARKEQQDLFRAFKQDAAAAVTEEDVGDADSFDRNVIYLGVAQTESVSLEQDCSAFPPEANCITLNPAPASTSFDEDDLAMITLPGKSTKSLVCFTVTPFAIWQFSNTTGVFQPNATFNAFATVRIESEVLNDPTLIDPITGLPFGGGFDTVLGTYSENRSLDVNDREFKRFTYTRSCIGGIVSRNSLEAMGLSDTQINQFFKKPITFRFGSQGNVQMVDFANFFYGVRLYGDK